MKKYILLILLTMFVNSSSSAQILNESFVRYNMTDGFSLAVDLNVNDSYTQQIDSIVNQHIFVSGSYTSNAASSSIKRRIEQLPLNNLEAGIYHLHLQIGATQSKADTLLDMQVDLTPRDPYELSYPIINHAYIVANKRADHSTEYLLVSDLEVNCAYKQNLDNIVDGNIYVSGTNDLDINCVSISTIVETSLGELPNGNYRLHYTIQEISSSSENSLFRDTTIVLNFKVEDLPSMLLDINRCWALMEEDGTTYKQAFSNNTIEADGKQYRCENQGLYAYREEDGKLYEYSIKDKSERLVFDTNLKTGDKLALAEGFSLEVEAMSDTMILYSIDVLLAPDTYEVSYDSIFAKYRRWHLRGVENPKYTDTWVEHVGSMKYGIHFPNPEKESRFLYSFLLDEDFCIYTNTFNSDYCNAFSIDMKDGHEMEGSRPSTYLKYTNENGNLRIKGYVKSQGGPIYAIMNMSNETEIHINPFEYLPPRYEGTVEDSVNFTLPGTYPQADYQIYFGEYLVKEAGKADNEIVFLPDGDKYSRTFSFAYDMSGFDLTDTYGGGEDKAWVIYAAQRYNWSYSDDMRKPAIPYLHYKILLPDGFKLKDFSYNCDSFCLASNITLATNEAANVLSGYYGFDVLHSESIMDGYTIADISIAPFAYDADKRNLYMATVLHLNITIAETSTEDVYHSGDMDDVIKTAIYNLEDFGKGTAPWEGTVSLPILSQESAESIWYDLRGRRVTAPESGSTPADGIYISKDKKVLILNR